jgi:hypothetical protein
LEKKVIRARGPHILALLAVCGFTVAGLVVVAHPGADPRLVSRLTAGGVISVFVWLFWQLGVETRIVLEDGEIVVHYPFLIRRVGSANVARVGVEGGDLTIRTTDGGKLKPPIFRASILGAASGHRGAKAAQREIEHYIVQGGPRADVAPHTSPRLQLWVLVVPLIILWVEALLTSR